MAPTSERTAAPQRRPDASMSLLVDLSTNALDPGYAAAAARRRSSTTPTRVAGRTVTALVVAGALVVVAAAALDTRHRAPAASRAHARLVAQVESQEATTRTLERRAAALRASTAALRDQALKATTGGAALSRRLAALETAAGTTPATGSSFVVTVGDAPGAGASGSDTGNRVLDRDVQDVVNALWAGGARAVAVDGERLGPQSTIRSAGEAILVNYRPVTSPYAIVALGNPEALETSFAASPAAARLHSLAQLYGLRITTRHGGTRTVPAAPSLQLRYARPVGGAG